MFKHLQRMFTEAGAFKAINTTQQMTHLIFFKAPVSLSLQLLRENGKMGLLTNQHCRH